MGPQVHQLAEIKELGALLDEGQQETGEVCPFCEGGRSREKSFSITRKDGMISYCCHRASCGEHGSLLANGRVGKLSLQPKRTEFVTELTSVPSWARILLEEKYELGDQMLKRMGASWDTKSERLYLPMLSWDKADAIGYNLRALDTRKPKSLIRLTQPDKPCMAFYGPASVGGVAFLVEDQFSAAKLSRYGHNGISLMGVNMNAYKAVEIRKDLAPALIIAAMDKDAMRKNTEHFTRYRGLFPQMRILELDKDIKDIPYAELDDIVKNITEGWSGQPRE